MDYNLVNNASFVKLFCCRHSAIQLLENVTRFNKSKEFGVFLI